MLSNCVSDPPGPVTSFSVDLLPDSDGVQITWRPPDNLTVGVLGYVITYRVVGIGDCNSTYTTPTKTLPQLSDHVDSYLLTGLTTWLKYRITVAALNIAGSGQTSSSDVIMPGSGTEEICFRLLLQLFKSLCYYRSRIRVTSFAELIQTVSQ